MGDERMMQDAVAENGRVNNPRLGIENLERTHRAQARLACEYVFAQGRKLPAEARPENPDLRAVRFAGSSAMKRPG